MNYEPVIGLEVHIEMLTKSKMFCSCPVVDSVSAEPNSAVCPICAGHPGTLPVLNETVVDFALRVATALGCRINPVSIFARKNYFYPDLPKGYQISQYEEPLAVEGQIFIGEKLIRIRRVHLEEDTGKLTHVDGRGTAESAENPVESQNRRAPTGGYSLVDLNRAGVPLLEIVTEPDFHSAEDVRAYAELLRALVRYLGVNSGDLEKGVMRVEPNISERPVGTETLGTKVEIKNLNSFRALERGVAYEISRQIQLIEAGGAVAQETVGWDEAKQSTYSQRSKEDAHDYRYFPEPDLPPLVVSESWMNRVRASLPELPWERYKRFRADYGLNHGEAWGLVSEKAAGEYFQSVLGAGGGAVRTVYAWVTGELFSLMNTSGYGFESGKLPPQEMAALLKLLADGKINQNTAKNVLAEMFASGASAESIVAARGLAQVSDAGFIAQIVAETLRENPHELESYRAGKVTVANFLFGQVMKKAAGKANPQVVRAELERRLKE